MVQSGLDVLVALGCSPLRGRRVGVLCHQASVDRSLRHILDCLGAAKVTVTAVFAPEHGLWGTAQDQVPITDEGPRAYSLYGDNRAPSLEQLADIDVMVCDLQDVGSRYYTFIWTMALAMQVCAKVGKAFIVLDRPNPLEWSAVLEGPVLDLNFASFVGLYATPVQHGMTIGEIAQWVNSTYAIWRKSDGDPFARRWTRRMTFAETGLPQMGHAYRRPICRRWTRRASIPAAV